MTAGRSGMTFGQGGAGNDTKDGGAVNEDNVKDGVCSLLHFKPAFAHPCTSISQSRRCPWAPEVPWVPPAIVLCLYLDVRQQLHSMLYPQKSMARHSQ